MFQFYCKPQAFAPVVVTPQAATPTFLPIGGTYAGTQSVVISCSTPASSIFYTTDGSTPTTSSTPYTVPVSVAVSETLKAIATAPGFTTSAVGSAAYVINGPAATPTFSPVAGSYAGTQTVTISCTTPSPTLYYTTDGSTPTFPITGTTQLYTAPVSVSVSETVRAIATAATFLTSAVGSATYTIGGALAGAGSNLVVNFPSGFSGQSTIQVGSAATQTGAIINITSAAHSSHSAGSAWYKTKVNITAFTTTFTFQIPIAPTIPTAGNNNPVGFSFAVQNTTAPPGPVGFVGLFYVADANLCGYGIFQTQAPSGGSNVGIKFDLNGITTAFKTDGIATPNSTGLYVNGGPYAALQPQNDLNPVGISFYAQHVMSCTLAYDGTILQMTLRDTVTNAQARYEWPINIPAIVGANTAWVGFTGGAAPNIGLGTTNQLDQNILTWTFQDGVTKFSRLASPTFSVPAGSYTGAQSVSLSGPGGASIYYTTNGQLPTTSSTLYTGSPISISASTILQAVAVQAGSTDSFVATANYQIAAGGTPLINFPSGFAGSSSLVNLVGYAQLNSGTKIRLTDNSATGIEVGCAWYLAPVPISTFTTNFQLQFNAGATGQGMTFCIQNFAPPSTTSTSQSALSWVSGGPSTMGLNFAGLGYAGPTGSNGQANAGIFESVAVKFDLTNNTTGIFTNGALPTTPQTTITGVTLNAGHPLNVTLAYNGTTLTLTITDTVTLGTFTTNFTVNIPAQVGASTAYVGFTGSTGFNTAVANQDILNWTM